MSHFRKPLLGGKAYSKWIDGWEVSWESKDDYRHWCIQRQYADAPLVLVVMLNPGKLSGDGRELANDATLRVLRTTFLGSAFNHVVINLFDLAASKKKSLAAQWARRDSLELVYSKLKNANFSGIIYAYGDIDPPELPNSDGIDRANLVKSNFIDVPVIQTPKNKSGHPAHPLNWQRRKQVDEVNCTLLQYSLGSGRSGIPQDRLKTKILYIDMDNVLVDFKSGIQQLPADIRAEYEGRLDEVPGIFSLMDPMPGGIDAFKELAECFDTYILSTSPWENSTAWSDKLHWVKENLGKAAYKRLILTHHKNLNTGDYLIDDRTKNGADRFPGEHIHFGTDEFPNWDSVLEYLRKR